MFHFREIVEMVQFCLGQTSSKMDHYLVVELVVEWVPHGVQVGPR